MHSYFRDKVIIITGSSMGIGKSLALLLGSFGAKIIINARTKEKLLETEKELKGKAVDVIAVVGDIAAESTCQLLIDTATTAFGRIDVIINNAGISMRGQLENATTEVVQKVFAVNTISPVVLSKLSLPYIKKTNGHIVFISSIAGFRGLPLLSVYSASKMALKAIAQTMWVEHAADNIHIGIVHVGYTEVEKGKTTLTADGKLVNLEERKSIFIFPKEAVAEKIARSIYKRKNETTIGYTSRLYNIINRFFPGMVNFLMKAFHSKIKKYYR